LFLGDVSTFAQPNNVLNEPSGIVAYAKDKSFFVTDRKSHTIIKITSSGLCLLFIIHTYMILISCLQGSSQVFVGTGAQGSADGIGTEASFNGPRGIAIDQQTGNLFVITRII
jgi:DNA-binding beta-propeller fold protein YncE